MMNFHYIHFSYNDDRFGDGFSGAEPVCTLFISKEILVTFIIANDV